MRFHPKPRAALDSPLQGRLSVLRISVTTSLIALVPTAYAAITSNSVTLLADLLRCLGEFLAILLSWRVLIRISRGLCLPGPGGCERLEERAQIAVGCALVLSALVALISACSRFLAPEPVVNATFGFLFAILSVLGNLYLMVRSYNASSKEYSPVMEAQWRLFRAKTAATLVVVISLGLSITCKDTVWSLNADPLGSALLGIFLLASGCRMIVGSIRSIRVLGAPTPE